MKDKHEDSLDLDFDLNIIEIVQRENPKVQAALEMEINAKEAAKDVLDYLSHGLEKEKEEFKDNKGDFQRFYEQYTEHMRTDEEKNLLGRVDTLFTEFEMIADELIGLKAVSYTHLTLPTN